MFSILNKFLIPVYSEGIADHIASMCVCAKISGSKFPECDLPVTELKKSTIFVVGTATLPIPAEEVVKTESGNMQFFQFLKEERIENVATRLTLDLATGFDSGLDCYPIEFEEQFT